MFWAGHEIQREAAKNVGYLWPTIAGDARAKIILKVPSSEPFTGCMSNLLGAISMFQSSVQGIGREFNRAAVAAAKVARADRGDKVTISAEARSQPIDSEETASDGIEAAMVDMRVAKYAAIANMRVLSVADDMAREEAKIIK